MAGGNLFNTDVLNDNLHSLNSVIRQSYKHIQEGISVIKDEFVGIYGNISDRASTYFGIIALPVNNFLKDLSQIEDEFRNELSKEAFAFNAAPLNKNIIPLERALDSCMEENY
jgi:hypothetical protein